MQRLLEILHKEVTPAQGCTEPIAVAYAVAAAAQQTQGEIQRIELCLSGNILKNAMGVGIPGTGQTGVDIAALLGAVVRAPEKKLEILSGLTADQLALAQQLKQRGVLKIALSDQEEKLYIDATVQTDQGSGRCVVAREHTNIVCLQRDGRSILQKEDPAQDGCENAALTVEEIYDFATHAPVSSLAFLLEGARMNKAVSQEGLRGDYGLRIGKTLRGQMEKGLLETSLANELISSAAAASDARMDGCAQPVMTTAGSGNQGIACMLPAVELASRLGSSQEALARALALSNLMTIHVKSYMGRLSPLCGAAIAGGTGACCAMVYLMGGGLEQIRLAINSMLADHMGMICDGAKTTCALKIATGVNAAVLCATLAMNGIAPAQKDGIVCADAEDTIRSVGKLILDGLPGLDSAILDVMLSKC